MQGNERVQSAKDLSQLTLSHDVQLEHGLVIHLVETFPRRGNLALTGRRVDELAPPGLTAD